VSKPPKYIDPLRILSKQNLQLKLISEKHGHFGCNGVSEEHIAAIFRGEEYAKQPAEQDGNELRLPFDPEHGGDMFLRNVAMSLNYKAEVCIFATTGTPNPCFSREHT
jgi:hypothetical protein